MFVLTNRPGLGVRLWCLGVLGSTRRCRCPISVVIGLLLLLGAVSGWASGASQGASPMEQRIVNSHRAESPILHPVLQFGLADGAGDGTKVSGPVCILERGTYVFSDTEEPAVFVRSNDTVTRAPLAYGQGPDEVMAVSAIVRRNSCEFTVVSRHFQTKLLTLGVDGAMVAATVLDGGYAAAGPTTEGVVALSAHHDGQPLISFLSEGGSIRRETSLSQALGIEDVAPPRDFRSYANAYGMVSFGVGADSVWAVSRYRTVLVKLSPSGSVERHVLVHDDAFPDGLSSDPYVYQGTRVASLDIAVDDRGFVFVIAGTRTVADDGHLVSHINVFDDSGELVGLLRLSGVAARHIGAFGGELLVSPGRYGGDLAVYDYSYLVGGWSD